MLPKLLQLPILACGFALFTVPAGVGRASPASSEDGFLSSTRRAQPALLTAPALELQDQQPNDPPVEESEPEDQDQDESEGDTQETDATKPPSLDDLLGLEKDEDTEGAREVAEREAEEEIERALLQRQIDDAFKEAIAKMAISAELLGEKFDTGLGTQRVQEEILRKLDQLIESARKQQSNSQSSSSSSSSQQQQQQQQARRQQPNDPDNNMQNPGQQPATDSAARPPAPDDRTVGSILQEDRIEWGALPPRIRDQLLQSRRENMSALYRRLTEEYFQRLADESSR